MSIRSILIANRGEIARRVIRTAKRLGLRTVAIHSPCDAELPYVAEADEAHALKGDRPLESYLDINQILDIAKKANVDAVHPGYGFLSENPKFSGLARQAGIIFIGPPPQAVGALGDKLAARETARRLDVPTIPASPALTTEAEAQSWAEKIGFPVIIKAAGGGGGIGMKRVDDPKDVAKCFQETINRAKSAFGNDRVYLEKYLIEPHHIEIQVFADAHGNARALIERECSIQRRHQKVIEESPSTYMTPDVRCRMQAAARRFVQGIGYQNAGTLEMMVDRDRNFYFLEVNARLQVEHPVTEAIYGVDLVEQQIRVADGATMEIPPDEQAKGHAIEARIYAEDPLRFLPSPGPLTTYVEAPEGVRIDAGYRQGNKVSPFYDPLVSKVIAWGKDREEARTRLLASLRAFRIEGIKTNIPFHIEAMESPLFRNGGYDTHFIERLRKAP